MVGWNLTGGTPLLWMREPRGWRGDATAKMYVNGGYQCGQYRRWWLHTKAMTAIFSVGTYDTGASASTGFIDEVAFTAPP